MAITVMIESELSHDQMKILWAKLENSTFLGIGTSRTLLGQPKSFPLPLGFVQKRGKYNFFIM